MFVGTINITPWNDVWRRQAHLGGPMPAKVTHRDVPKGIPSAGGKVLAYYSQTVHLSSYYCLEAFQRWCGGFYVRLPTPTLRNVPPQANITIPAVPITVARAPPRSPKLKKLIPVVRLLLKLSRDCSRHAISSGFKFSETWGVAGVTAAPLVCEVFAWFVVFCGGRKVAGAARSVGRDARRESSPWGAHPTGAKIQGSYRRQSEAQSRHAYLRGHRLGYAFPQFRSVSLRLFLFSMIIVWLWLLKIHMDPFLLVRQFQSV